MCYKCFHASQHLDHDTAFSISSVGGGCCDCGDPEAWTTPCTCLYHAPIPPSSTSSIQTSTSTDSSSISPSTPSTSLSSSLSTSITHPELLNHLHCILATLLDFVIDVYVHTPCPPISPTSLTQIVQEPSESHVPLEISHTWIVALWNDEVHSFNEVIDIVIDATGVTRDKAEDVAGKVDQHVRRLEVFFCFFFVKIFKFHYMTSLLFFDGVI